MAHELDTLAAASTDAHELMNAAARAAASKDGADHEVLRKHLLNPGFLDKLDSAKDYQAPPQQLRLARVIKTLMDNRSPASDATMTALVQDKVFVSVEPRQELMIRALAVVRPSPTPAVTYWREHSLPTAPYKHVAMDAMADNGSEPAMRLFEENMANPSHEEQNKVAWMHDPILRNRYSPGVLASCERMLKSGLPETLRPALVASLADYREEWYLSCDHPVPPSRAAASQEAKTILLRIEEDALARIPLDPRTKAAVEADLKWLRK